VTGQQIAVLALAVVAIAAIYAILRGGDVPDASLSNPREIPYDGSGLRIPRRKDSWPEGDHSAWVEWKGPRVQECLAVSFGKEELINIDRSFATRLVGVKHSNDDGTSRVGAIERLWPHERLVVRWEEGYSKGDGFGKSVSRQDGQQLGWLGREIAKEIHADFVETGHTWMAVFQYPTRHPRTGETVGAVILVVRRTPAGGDWFWDRDQNTQLSVVCPTCGATIGDYCKTKKGGGTYSAHVARIKAFQELMKQRNEPTSTG
jgi:hypothetical protein